MEDEDEEQAHGSRYFIQQYLLSLDITKKLQIMLHLCLRVSPLDKNFKGNIKWYLGCLLDSNIRRVIKANEDLPQEHHRFFLHQLLRGLKYLHTESNVRLEGHDPVWILIVTSTILYRNEGALGSMTFVLFY
nr:hypothetical protein [Tanacetum cinerariifolium]